MWRGIRKEVVGKDGLTKIRTEADVWAYNPDNSISSHRYTGPGDMGRYGVVGEEADAKRLIALEIDVKNQDDIVFSSRKLHFTKMLQLTDENRLRQLNISHNSITMAGKYELTQQLDHLAQKHGYDAVLFPSSKEAKN